MRAKQFTTEAAIGTNPKRPSREGSRPERGHEPQKRYVTDRKTGKQYDPEEEFDKLKNSDEFQAQMKRMAQKEGVAEAGIDRPGMKDGRPYSDPYRRHPGNSSYMTPEYLIQKYKERLAQIAAGPYKRPKEVAQLQSRIAKLEKQGVAEGFDYTMKDLGNDFSGFPSNHSLKHKMMKRISPEHHQLYKDKINNTHDSDQLVKLFHVAKGRGHVINEGTSDAMANAAKRLTDPNDGKTAKLRAAGDKRREEHLKSRDIAKKNEAIDRMAAELEEAKAPRALCKSSTPDEDLGASQLSSCKSQGLRARDGNKSHKLGKSSKSRVKVGGKRIKGNKYGGPLPDWS